MKLSEAIEHALVNEVYYLENAFMCNAMCSMGHTAHIPHIEGMLNTIDPGDHYTLSDALVSAYPEMVFKDKVDRFAFTSQLYVWWVFDLKRKGL